MAKTVKQKKPWTTPIGTARFCALVTPKSFKNPETGQLGNPRFEANVVIDEADLPKVKAYLKAVGEEFHPGADFVKLPLGKDEEVFA